MSVNNKFNPGDRIKRVNQYGDVLIGVVTIIYAEVSVGKRQVSYKVIPDPEYQKRWKDCHCTYREEEWTSINT